MKITALRNFKCNGVKATPGYLLTQDECEAVNPLLSELLKEKLIFIEDGQPASEPPGSSGLIDPGPDAKDDLPDAPEDANEQGEGISEAPAKPSKSKKK